MDVGNPFGPYKMILNLIICIQIFIYIYTLAPVYYVLRPMPGPCLCIVLAVYNISPQPYLCIVLGVYIA